MLASITATMHTSLALLFSWSCATLAVTSIPDSAFQAPAGTLPKSSRGPDAKMQGWGWAKSPAPADLKDLAKKLNPAIGYYDPLQLGKAEFWGQSNDATVGFLRHAEIKHGRVAMAAFIGYLVQSNGIVWPWKLTAKIAHSDIAKAHVNNPPEQWDALPTSAKLQIIVFIGFLEMWSETSYILKKDGDNHYMRGGTPGKFPSFEQMPHPVPFDLYDPFRLNAKKTRKELDRALLAELNNGRLAQLGIMGFLAEQKLPGAVPFLKGMLKPYAGQPMAAFSNGDERLYAVKKMLEIKGPLVDALGGTGKR